MKYNFVIFQVPHDYYSISYNDVYSYKEIKYFNEYPENVCEIIKLFHRIHYSSNINKLVSLPFKNIWNPFIFKNSFIDDKPLCFIFSGATAIYAKYGLITYLKKKYPNSKYVCFYQDLIERYKIFSIEEAKNKFDLIISFDKKDSIKYNTLYHPTQYSKIEIEPKNSFTESDVYFMGAAKDRFSSIISTYEKMKSNGLKCKFYVTGVPKWNRVYRNEINYIKHMSYIENLQHIQKTKAILEIMQKNATGYTLRMWEALTYSKFLITNNEEVRILLNNSTGFIMLDSIHSQNLSEKMLNRVHYDQNLYHQMSIQSFLKFIQIHF